jgi:hypothetical protein
MAFAGTKYLPLRKVVYSYRVHPGSFTINSLDSRDPSRGKVRIKVLNRTKAVVFERFLRSPSTPEDSASFPATADTPSKRTGWQQRLCIIDSGRQQNGPVCSRLPAQSDMARSVFIWMSALPVYLCNPSVTVSGRIKKGLKRRILFLQNGSGVGGSGESLLSFIKGMPPDEV